MKAKFTLTGLTAAFILLLASISHANNLQIGTPTQPSANQIQFTISWNNAWNNSSGIPANWDAAWVFVKQQDCSVSAPQPWNHVTISTTAGANIITGGSGNMQVDTASDGMGVFIRVTNASSPFTGSVSGTVTLTFASTPTNTDNYKVFGIEMVYVPQGSYVLGDNFSQQSYTMQTISSEAQITNASTTLGGQSASTALVASYPKGFNAFYCMKYEITQHQYVDFLNTLTYAQQTVYITQVTQAAGNWAMGNSPNFGYNRNSVKIVQSGVSTGSTFPAVYGCDLGTSTGGATAPNNTYNEAFDGQDIACNWMSWTDMLGYLSWSGLRPMTDLEYEKACRGPVGSVPAEYSWGTNQITPAQSYSNTTNNGQNGIGELGSVPGTFGVATGTSTSGLCAYTNTQSTSLTANSATSGLQNFGPLRVGFAATGSTTRVSAGATYWGILDMTGNVWERTVGTVSTLSCGFTGANGNGTLTLPANWTSNISNVTTLPYDLCDRGGSWTAVNNVATFCPVSSRYNYFGNNLTLHTRTLDAGGRGVRTHQ